MASEDRTIRLTAIRDNLEKELQNETARRLTLTEAGHPPPTTYSTGGRSLSWNEYLSTLTAQIRDLNELINVSTEPAEYHVRGYS